jgi:hypothetical protein
MIEFDEDMDEEWGWYDGQCYACDLLRRVDDLGLCEECRTKLERDLVRQRDWDYSAWAIGLSDEGRKKLYQQVITQYGKRTGAHRSAGRDSEEKTLELLSRCNCV